MKDEEAEDQSPCAKARTRGAMRRPESSAVHVLIVHYNTPHLTTALLADIPQRTPSGRDVNIHIFDNCSSQQNVAFLQEGVGITPNVTLKISEINIGFGEGHNALMENSDIKESDVIWILNPDMRLRSDCLELLERELDTGPYSVVSPLIYAGDDSKPWIWYAGGSIITPQLRGSHHLWGSSLDEAPESPFETEFVTGAAPMMTAATFRTAGGFPEDYFLYWEDAYFSWEAHRQGFKIGVVPGAQAWHAVGAASGSSQSPTYYYWATRNRFVFAADIGIPRWQLLVGSGGLESIRAVLKALCEPEDRAQKTNAALKGTLHGLRMMRTIRKRGRQVRDPYPSISKAV